MPKSGARALRGRRAAPGHLADYSSGGGNGMSTLKIGREHKARKALFTRGIRRGFLTLDDIDQALPAGSLSDAERWLLFYSLHAARVEVRDGDGRSVDLDELRPASDQLRPAPDDGDDAQDDGDAAYDPQ